MAGINIKTGLNGSGNQFGGGKNAQAHEAGDGDGYCGSATQVAGQANQSMSPGKGKMGTPKALLKKAGKK